MALPYITEAYILGIPDEEVISRTAVLLRVKEGKCLNLQTLRMEMAERLAEHKLRTLLRMLDSSEDAPKTHSGKFDMPKARSVFFPQSIAGNISDLPPEVEVWKLK
jgi:malonyl-CoA/methylmalonyl-CoA synthetase